VTHGRIGSAMLRRGRTRLWWRQRPLRPHLRSHCRPECSRRD